MGWDGPSCSYPIQGALVQIRSLIVWVDTAMHQSSLLGEWSSAGCQLPLAASARCPCSRHHVHIGGRQSWMGLLSAGASRR